MIFVGEMLEIYKIVQNNDGKGGGLWTLKTASLALLHKFRSNKEQFSICTLGSVSGAMYTWQVLH